jgi:plasmid replication initiation protein
MDTIMSGKNELVVKSNRLVEASYRLTLAEQRIILFSITEARRTQKGLNANDFLTIQAADYAEMFNVPVKQAYEQIKEAGRTLFRRYLVMYDIHPESGKDRMTELRWISKASYIDGAGAIQIRFEPDIIPYITRLEAEFTSYRLEKIAHMSSAYAIRLYELLIQWGSVGRREIEMEWLKKALMVDKDYPRLFDFKKWVIDVALSQINEHSDLNASYNQRKTGRNVTHLIFTF